MTRSRLAASLSLLGFSPFPGISDPVSGREAIASSWAGLRRDRYRGRRRRRTHGDRIFSDADLDHFFAAHGDDSEGYFVGASFSLLAMSRPRALAVATATSPLLLLATARAWRLGRLHRRELRPPNCLAIRWPFSPAQIEAPLQRGGLRGPRHRSILVGPDGVSTSRSKPAPAGGAHHRRGHRPRSGARAGPYRFRSDALRGSRHARAHSFEFRITCEDPGSGMIPSTGAINRLRWPLGHGVRVESGIVEEATSSPPS